MIKIPQFVKYPKYLITAELASLDAVYKKFKTMPDTEDAGRFVSRNYPFIVKKDNKEFLSVKADYSFWEQRVLLGVLSLFTRDNYSTNTIETNWRELRRNCFLQSGANKNNKYSYSHKERACVQKSLIDLSETSIFIPDYNKQVILHPEIKPVLFFEESIGFLQIKLNLSNNYLKLDAENNFNSIPSNIFTFIKSGSKYSPRFFKWLVRQEGSKTVIDREKLAKTLGMEKCIKSKNWNWIKRTLHTAYQEAKNAGILLDYEENGQQDVFYKVNKFIFRGDSSGRFLCNERISSLCYDL